MNDPQTKYQKIVMPDFIEPSIYKNLSRPGRIINARIKTINKNTTKVNQVEARLVNTFSDN